MAGKISGGLGAKNARAIRLLQNSYTHKSVIPNNGLWFPVAPPELGVSTSSTWNSFRVTNKGELSHRGGRNAKVVEVNTLLPPAFDWSLCQALRSPSDFYSAEVITSKLTFICDESVVFRLLIGDDLVDLPMKLTDFSWVENSRYGRDFRQVSCRFEEFITAEITTLDKKNIKPIPKRYVLRQGEDLQDAALRIYGDIKYTPVLAAANGVPATTSRAGASAARRTVVPTIVTSVNTAGSGVDNVRRVLRIPQNPGSLGTFW